MENSADPITLNGKQLLFHGLIFPGIHYCGAFPVGYASCNLHEELKTDRENRLQEPMLSTLNNLALKGEKTESFKFQVPAVVIKARKQQSVDGSPLMEERAAFLCGEQILMDENTFVLPVFALINTEFDGCCF
ncbi:hypothetical protein E5288_WYG020485 [Bos mutus]|uniref:Uncharacterized protein n=1 Tax=Bos mutus TaxID=72004 RepID=A0A6B0S9W4_9CETA|nr:hypothetical protein [Bos mutus]